MAQLRKLLQVKLLPKLIRLFGKQKNNFLRSGETAFSKVIFLNIIISFLILSKWHDELSYLDWGYYYFKIDGTDMRRIVYRQENLNSHKRIIKRYQNAPSDIDHIHTTSQDNLDPDPRLFLTRSSSGSFLWFLIEIGSFYGRSGSEKKN